MRLLPLLLLTLSATTALSAQDFDTTAFGRVAQRRYDALTRETNAKGAPFNRAAVETPFIAMNDSMVVAYARLLGDFLGRATLAECSQAMESLAGDADFSVLLQQLADSSDAEALFDLDEAAIRRSAFLSGPEPMADGERLVQVVGGLMHHSSAKQQLGLQKAAAGSAAGGCVFAPWLLRRLAAKSPARIAPAIRSFLVMSFKKSSESD